MPQLCLASRVRARARERKVVGVSDGGAATRPPFSLDHREGGGVPMVSQSSRARDGKLVGRPSSCLLLLARQERLEPAGAALLEPRRVLQEARLAAARGRSRRSAVVRLVRCAVDPIAVRQSHGRARRRPRIAGDQQGIAPPCRSRPRSNRPGHRRPPAGAERRYAPSGRLGRARSRRHVRARVG